MPRLYRWFIYKRMDLLLLPITKKNSKQGRRLGGKVMQYMRASVKAAALHQRLEPDCAMGCKRILLSDNLSGAINRDNVRMIETGGMEKMVCVKRSAGCV
ncbi:MAG: hypothetical protein OEM60_01210 [Gammaproteobacteria bacterium]|nr:hypothetical protein [Gammaproteobacteria bacterium]